MRWRSCLDIYAVVMYLYPCNVLLFVPMQIKLNVPESSKHLYCTREAHTKLASVSQLYKVQSQSRYYLIVTRLESITTVTKCHPRRLGSALKETRQILPACSLEAFSSIPDSSIRDTRKIH